MLKKFIEAKDRLLARAGNIKSIPYLYVFPEERRALLENIAIQANSDSPVISYIGGGCDSATVFLLYKNARKLINISIGKLYNILETEKKLYHAANMARQIHNECSSTKNISYRSIKKFNSLSFDIFQRGSEEDSYDILPKPGYHDQLEKPTARPLLIEMAKMYALDKSILTNIIPMSFQNNQLIPDNNGNSFQLTFDNGSVSRIVEVISCDYSVFSPEAEAVNNYIRSHTDLRGSLIKAPLNIFNRDSSLGYFNFYQAHANLNGIVIHDAAGMDYLPIDSLSTRPRTVRFDEENKKLQFGYHSWVSFSEFSGLIPIKEAYRKSILYPQILQLLENPGQYLLEKDFP